MLLTATFSNVQVCVVYVYCNIVECNLYFFVLEIDNTMRCES